MAQCPLVIAPYDRVILPLGAMPVGYCALRSSYLALGAMPVGYCALQLQPSYPALGAMPVGYCALQPSQLT